MRRLPLFAILPCFVFAATQNAGKPQTAAFQARYDALTKAYLTKDVNGVAKLIADDYSAGTYQRPLDKKSTLESLRHWDGRFKTASRIVIGVIVNGDKATATTNQETVGKITDKVGTHKIVIKAQCMDTWQKNAPGWQLKHSRVIHSATTIDGKPAGAPKAKR